LHFKCNLQRYSAGEGAATETIAAMAISGGADPAAISKVGRCTLNQVDP
jgi:hypothetical protein